MYYTTKFSITLVTLDLYLICFPTDFLVAGQMIVENMLKGAKEEQHRKGGDVDVVVKAEVFLEGGGVSLVTLLLIF